MTFYIAVLIKYASRHSSYKVIHAAQKMKFFIKDFLSKYDQTRRKLRIRSHLLKKSLMENFIFLCSDRPPIAFPIVLSLSRVQTSYRNVGSAL